MSDKKYWENYYKDLDKYNKDFLKDNWMNKYKKIICSVKNNNAIDLGCGLGQDTQWLTENKFNVISCDISSLALTKLKNIQPNANTMQLDITDDLPFNSNSIGLVNANLSLHYFSMDITKKIFNNIFDILEPGGLFIGRMNSNKNNYIDKSCEKIEDNFYYDTLKEKHIRLFDEKQFNSLIEKWKIIILNEDKTIRLGREKYTWEFIFQK